MNVLNREKLIQKIKAKRELKKRAARTNFLDFIEYTKPDYETNWHHEVMAKELQLFAEGKTKRLMFFLPPQFGKSEQTSRRLPAFLLGLNPDRKIVGCAYGATLAAGFNRDVQRIIDTDVYNGVFPETTINSTNVKTSSQGSYLRNADVFEVVGHKGYYKSVGIGGGLTGTTIDVGIIDDPVKDHIEAESSTYRERAWDWFFSVFMTRLHNDSQVLITQTRWHKDDLSGRIIDRLNKEGDWKIVTLEALKDKINHPDDPRKEGESLWESKHSRKKILEIKNGSPKTFNALYQQDPKPSEDKIIISNWREGEFDESLPALWGQDYGYSNDPTTLLKVAVNEKRKKIYVKECFYKGGLDTEQIYRWNKHFAKDNGLTIADNAEPRLIAELKKKGLNVKACIKGPDSIRIGIKLLQEYEIIVHPDSHNMKTEFNFYTWSDRQGEVPVDDNNHLIDPLRYVISYLRLKKKKRYIS